MTTPHLIIPNHSQRATTGGRPYKYQINNIAVRNGSFTIPSSQQPAAQNLLDCG